MTLDLQAVRASAEAIARQAGIAVLEHFGKPHTETTKVNIFDVVTEGDKASEAVILAALRASSPYPIVSEESGRDAGVEAADYAWYIDPIDGTTNYASNLPFFCISIALARQDMTPVVGVVYNPVYGEMFSAAEGFGATLNGQPVRVKDTPVIERAVLSTGFSYRRHDTEDNNLKQWKAMLMRCRDMRRFGSAALDMAFVGAGRLDGFWEKNINAWDCLGGIVCVREAGGTATDYSGGTSRLYTGEEVVLTNGLLHETVLDIINQP